MMTEDELTDDEKVEVEHADYWVGVWARSQRNDAAELRPLLYPAVACGTEMATTNYAVAEDDMDSYYERHVGNQVALVGAAMDDLAAGPHWAAWAIWKRHKLGHGGVWRYERLAPGGVIPEGLYTNALLELAPLLALRGLVPS